MKKILVIIAGLILASSFAHAQTATSKKDKMSTVQTKEGKTPVTNTESKDIHPSYEKRLHAEQMSNGHAFSGKGKGGEKNIIDPGEQLSTVTDKSDKVPVTTTDTQKKKDKMTNKKTN